MTVYCHETRQRSAYRSELRAGQSAATQERIVSAAAENAELAALGALTFAEVARRARVSERTVYRHFPTGRALQEAVIQRLEQEAGWPAGALTGDQLLGLPRTLFQTFARHGVGSEKAESVAARESRALRYAAIQGALRTVTADMDARQAKGVAAVFQALTSVDTFRRMARHWSLDVPEAAAAASWAMRVLFNHLQKRRAMWPEKTSRQRRA